MWQIFLCPYRKLKERMKMHKITACLFAVFFAFPAQAKQIKDPFNVSKTVPLLQQQDICRTDVNDTELNLADVINLALCNNPKTKASYMGAMASAAEYGVAKSSYLPTADISASMSQYDTNVHPSVRNSNASNLKGSLSLNWLLYDFGGRDASVSEVKYALASVLYSRSDVLQSLIYDVVRAYYLLFAAEEEYQNCQATVDSAKLAYDAASKRYELGLVALSDKLQAETSYAQAQLTATEAEEAVSLAKGNLALLLNFPPNKSFLLKPETYTPEKMNFDQKIEDMLEIALNSRADIIAKKADLKKTLASVDYEKAQNSPSFSVSAGMDAQDDLTHGDSREYSTRVGLSMTVPLFTGFKNQYRVTKARYQAAQTKAELTELQNSVQKDVWDTFQSFRTARKSYEISLTLLKSADMNANVALGAYKAGKGNILNVLDAQSKQAEARTSKSKTFYQLLISKSNLIRAMGLIDPFKPEKGF